MYNYPNFLLSAHQCTVADTQQVSTQAVNFISRSELLMDKAVMHQYSQPIFYQGNCLLQKMAVVKNVSGHGDIVFFAASSEYTSSSVNVCVCVCVCV